ncbi:Ig-like domain-containing protein [Luteolibacter sp. LG18]|uniref:Ig-like domain-containing protein n=1 Tax=Luteolibacter sp. LG18 TaxID=2819286 RepID=UPI0030C6D70D
MPVWRRGCLSALLILAALTATAKAQDPNNPPASFTRTYTYSGGSTTVTFNKQSVRGPNYEVYVHTGGTSFTSYTPTRPVRTYIGTLSGFPGAIAAGQLLSDGSVRTSLIFEDGTTWRGSTTSFTMPSAASWTPKYPTNVVTSGGAGSSVYAADVGLDLSYSYYNSAGLSTDEALERAEFSMIETNAIYLRDFAVQPRIGRIVLRTNSADDPSSSLSNVQSQWNTVLPGVLPAADFDEATTVVVTGSGGLAYVSNIHTSASYAWVSISSSVANSNFCTVWRHEFGHNWGSNDNQDDHTEGNTIMNGNGLSRFASSELAKMIPYRNTRTSVLDNVGSYGFPLPPRANADRAKVHFSLTDLTLDVLANDSDSNGQTITITSFPSTSNGGASITRSVGTGPGGRDQLIYHPSSSITGLDYFSYRIQDSAGYQSVGWVMIQPPTQAPDPDIAADVNSVSSGAWSTTSVWSDAAVPAAGKNYGISSSHTVDSAPNNVSSGGTVTFAGDTLAVNPGGMLRLSHSSAGGTTTYTSAFDGGLILRGGSTLQSYNSNVGNVTRTMTGPLVIGTGTSTIRIQSDSGSSYTNALRVNDGIFGTGNINLTGTLQGQSGERRFLYMAMNNVAYSGNWNVTADGTTDNTRRLFLVAEAANSLGTGTVTLNTRAQLRNSAAGGLDSLYGVTLTTATSTLQLTNPWVDPAATLDLQAGTLDLGTGASTVGILKIGGNTITPGTYNATTLGAFGYGGTFSGTGTITIATIPSVASGDWTTTSVWADATAPASGKNYRVASANTVDSVSASVASGGTVTFPGDWVTVANGGILRLRHTSGGGNNTHTVDLKELLLESGATFQSYNTSLGNVSRNMSNPVSLGTGGSVTVRLQSDSSSAYSNTLRINGALTGSADINLTATLQGQSGERRLLYVAAANNAYTGNWTVTADGTTDNTRRLYLVAEAANALGTGAVTLSTRAQLRNSATAGLDSLHGVTLATSTSTLQLTNAWNKSNAVLTMTAGTLDLGSVTSTIGTMTIGGTNVAAGTYTATSLAALGYGGTFSGSGSLVITGDLP